LKDLSFLGRVVNKLVVGVSERGESISLSPFSEFGKCPNIASVYSVVEFLVGPVPFGIGDCVLEGLVGGFGGGARRCSVGGHVCLGACIIPPACSFGVGGVAGF
jgi:hypothetical protein